MNAELSFGQKAVGLTFNPSGDAGVNYIKEQCANLIDLLNGMRAAGSFEQARMFAIAITDIQTAQMWAVKGVTWKD